MRKETREEVEKAFKGGLPSKNEIDHIALANANKVLKLAKKIEKLKAKYGKWVEGPCRSKIFTIPAKLKCKYQAELDKLVPYKKKKEGYQKFDNKHPTRSNIWRDNKANP